MENKDCCSNEHDIKQKVSEKAEVLSKKEQKTITGQSQRALNTQTIILVLLILVGALQTAQLFGIRVVVASNSDQSVSNTPTVTSASSSAGQTDSSSGESSLPTMVGGC